MGSPVRWNGLFFVVSSQEGRGELGSRSLVAAFATLAARSAITAIATAFAARSAIPATVASTAVTAWTPVATAPIMTSTISTIATAFAARTPVAALTRLPGRTGVRQFFAGLLVDKPHR